MQTSISQVGKKGLKGSEVLVERKVHVQFSITIVASEGSHAHGVHALEKFLPKCCGP
jgi:hypothetical protein